MIILSKRMMDGRGNASETVWINPRPFKTKLALLEKTRFTALRVEQIWMGWKFALSTRTSSSMIFVVI